MAASVPENDYVHRFATGISAITSEDLRTGATGTAEPANVVNIADTFERQYATYTNARLQRWFDTKPDIVIMQFGETRDGPDPATAMTALQTLMSDLEDASDPHISVVSQLLGPGGELDDIKRAVCAEDPA